MSKLIDPQTLPKNEEDIARHRDNPTLMRDYVLHLPDGYSLYYLCKIILGYNELDPFVHGTLCEFLEHPKYGRFRDATVPRSWFKTSIATVGKSIWLPIRRNRNIKILIAMNTADNADKRIHLIKHHWESNPLLRGAFPELVPDLKRARWSNSCAELNRTKRSEEGTYESIGVGGAVVSRHYDHIDEDDLVFCRKDDMSGTELAPNQDDIDKAIGWHKLVYSLFSNPAHSTIDNIGTRWAVHDLKRWLRDNEGKKYSAFSLSAEKADGTVVWPNRFDRETLDDIRDSQGPYMYATQYLNLPRDPDDALFKREWLQEYNYKSEIPEPHNTATVVDLALWGDSKGVAKNVVLTVARDADNHLWVMRYDRGKFDPSQVISMMELHHKLYKSTVYVEEVYYQKALRHFARKRMEDTDNYYPLHRLKNDSGKGAKENRIRTIQPRAMAESIHIKPSMKELIVEYCDYPSGRTCDILDCLGYITQRKIPYTPDKTEVQDKHGPFVLETILEDLAKKNSSVHGYPFQLQCKKPERNVYG